MTTVVASLKSAGWGISVLACLLLTATGLLMAYAHTGRLVDPTETVAQAREILDRVRSETQAADESWYRLLQLAREDNFSTERATELATFRTHISSVSESFTELCREASGPCFFGSYDAAYQNLPGLYASEGLDNQYIDMRWSSDVLDFVAARTVLTKAKSQNLFTGISILASISVVALSLFLLLSLIRFRYLYFRDYLLMTCFLFIPLLVSVAFATTLWNIWRPSGAIQLFPDSFIFFWLPIGAVLYFFIVGPPVYIAAIKHYGSLRHMWRRWLRPNSEV